MNCYSGETDIGMSRLTLSDPDKQVRDWFVETTKSLGCTTTIDTMGMHHPPSIHSILKLIWLIGNIFAVRPGKKDGPPTYAGSHLDTQVSSKISFFASVS